MFALVLASGGVVQLVECAKLALTVFNALLIVTLFRVLMLKRRAVLFEA